MKNNAILPIRLGNLKNETHVQFGETVNTHIIGAGVVMPGTEALYALFTGALTNEKQALDFNRKSGHTELIMEQDHVRDRVFRGFSDTVKGLTNHFDAAVRADAGKVWNILSVYGNIAHKALDDETAAISDLLGKLSAPEPSEAIVRLKVTDWTLKLDEENKKFHALMMERYGETSAKTPYRMKTARKETDRYYRAMASEIENLVLKGKATPELHRFIDGLNAIVARFNSVG